MSPFSIGDLVTISVQAYYRYDNVSIRMSPSKERPEYNTVISFPESLIFTVVDIDDDADHDFIIGLFVPEKGVLYCRVYCMCCTGCFKIKRVIL